MAEAIRWARRGVGTTHPNPRVGAVVLRGGSVVARGWHERAGEAHAETRALLEAGPAAAGATLVVTLEPCAHVGRTPPCVDAIREAKIRRVVVGMVDPNPLVDGKGVEALRRAGIEVVLGLREEECRALNPPYLKWRATGLPWVTLKSMVSLDGRVASQNGESRGLGGPEEQRLVHRLRSESDAVLIGSGTALRDDPLLTARLGRRRKGAKPWRVVLDSALRTPLDSKLVRTAAAAPLVLATCSPDAGRAGEYEARGAVVWRFEPDARGRVPAGDVLRRLAAEGRYAVLVEGGPTVHTTLLREGLADEVAVGIAPVLLGGASAPTWTADLGREGLEEAIPVGPLAVRRLGRDIWLSGPIEPARRTVPREEEGHV
ncbi:MAG TPA: bifunctional diaminohydroxyphosphoribosylaminopyrimidine deaminase/5-amino-6-(5-phosphoribosylamino)uracil reductase RibD [Candidatus Omnitrophota bacterium]|jgi:diaminohydroxyphosphoribosylaminopyrimidine deaminase/5-amino-6-(5-phosphoribosylamino)uracil reductase|nr:bifunctional diaminohydroxyphosphoribosylaminopyrimidine deaminase/5-amino-6-(5-phosphoribosylamino)uracil reductase RibD [Candidatus Omnitrophota bacterium]